MKKILLYGFLIVFGFASGQAKMEVKNERSGLTDSLTTEIDIILKQGYIKGLGVAIVNQDTTLYAKGFGMADVANNKPYTIHTIQNIASVSKTLIGIALLKAQETEKLSLTDAINNYLPFRIKNPFYPEQPILVQHLATHTSTIQDGDLYGEKSYILQDAESYQKAQSMQTASEFNLPNADMGMGVFLKEFLDKEGAWYQKKQFMRKKPGERFEYSNVGATLAAYTLEVATNKPYSQFTKNTIMEPLGMGSSGWTFKNIDAEKLSKLYALDGETIPFYKLITYPDGGLLTSIHDMTIYLRELINGYNGKGRLLSNKSYEQLFAEWLTAENFEERDTGNPFDDEYNSGIFFGHTPTGYIGHTGGDPGVATFMFFNPKTNIGKLLFVNTDLDKKGAEQFFQIWNTLGSYETRLNEAIPKH